MLDKSNPALAINGGTPVTGQPVLIHKPYLDEDDFAAIDRAVRSTFVSGDGPECRRFEEMLAGYLGAKHVLFVNSATAALELAFRVKGFPPGSEVIVPDFTYTSTALGAVYNNLKIVLADVYADNGSLDVSKLEQYITARTVAIAPVDYAGIPADMEAINAIARRHGLYVVHDTAQSLGSLYRGRRTGTLADISTFSFHGTKNLTTGEGGAVVTDDDAIAARIRVLREKGTDKHTFITENRTRGFYEYVDTGNSYVQSNILGALGVSQLKKIDMMNGVRGSIAKYYIDNLSSIEEIEFIRITEGAETNWHIFGILVPPEDRYWVMDALRDEGVMANVHYSPLHMNRFYRELATDDEMPGSMKFFSRFLRLPLYPSLTQEERETVVRAVKKVFKA
ncbi:MAG: DegT/DnrJ/EryC1/StrS aminotransferase family protein [Bacteroidales bacterium]|nr:DegT/DnrJ/EryC1/StrS aminotransferase family protein [Bacteroidales bacterium]MCB9028989.1 DegT/DnrJ/EryC1/StrS aminotransferase family protein [Bacteroidales bacterium]HOO67404.1 DegT/DnrJ/EryC1/StrS aminotransferase family protein [Bacteroidales bacterium]